MFGQDIPGSGSALVVEARSPTSESWCEVHRLVFANGSTTNETFKLFRGDNYRQFRLTFKKGVGTLRVRFFEVTWREDGEVEVPHSLKAVDVDADSFMATWAVDYPVECFLFDCWNESMTSWTGDRKWTEDFGKCVNGTERPKSVADDAFDQYTDIAGWSGAYVYLPGRMEGVVQVSKAEDSVGWLVSPELPEMGPVELVVRARAFVEQPDHIMPVFLIRDGATNDVASFELTTAFTDCHCSIPEIREGDRLAFRSFSEGKQRRVLIDGVSLVEGFMPGQPVRDFLHESEVVEYSESPGYLVEGLSVGNDYIFSVRAVSGGVTSEVATVCKVTTRLQDDVKSAISISGASRKGGVRFWQEDFDGFTNVFQTSNNSADWLNGTTIPYWQAYYGGAAVTGITRNNGAKSQAGLYAYWATNKLVSTYSLGTMTGGEAEELVYGLAFKNDTAFSVRKVSVRYDGMQFGFKNSGAQVLICECLVTNELVSVVADGAWMECADISYSTSKDKESGLDSGNDLPVATPIGADIFGVDIPKDSYLLLRWRRSAISNAAAMAIDNLTVSFEVQSRPMTIVLR
jgi:hypothetical protein